MTALITGVGYIGSALAASLLAQGEDVVGLDNFYCTRPRELTHLVTHPRFHLLEGTVTDPRWVEEGFASGTSAVTDVYHLAAQPSAAVAQQDPSYTEQTNLVGSRLVLEAAMRHRARVIFGGSARVYGDTLPESMDESLPYGRVTDLSHLSKMYVEQLGRLLAGDFISVRLGVVYGCAPVPVMKNDPCFMTVPNLFCRLAVQGEPLHVHEHRGLGLIHVDDAVEALQAASRLLQQSDGEGWQVANALGEVRTVDEVARCVQALMAARGRRVALLGAQESQAATVVRSRLSAVGFSTRRTLEDSLAAVLDYWEQVEA